VPGLFGQRKRPRVRHVVPSPAPSAPSFALLFPPVSSPFLPCGHGPGHGAGDPVLQQMWQLHVRPPPQRPGGRLPQCQDKTGADAPQRSSPLTPRPARQDFALLGPWSSRAKRLGGICSRTSIRTTDVKRVRGGSSASRSIDCLIYHVKFFAARLSGRLLSGRSWINVSGWPPIPEAPYEGSCLFRSVTVEW